MILITGADGFIGSALCNKLSREGRSVRAAVRERRSSITSETSRLIETATVGSIAADTDWQPALDGVRVVIHLAARAHMTQTRSGNAIDEYRKVNVEATKRLAQTAAATGVRRFLFMSTIKVNGERTAGQPFTEAKAPQPEDAYGNSKWEAEQALGKIARDTGMELVVMRAPLVYGADVKGNFLRLMRWVERGWPLPFGSVQNLRSLIYLGNLIDAIVACMDSPAAARKTYLVSDGEDLSTPDLIKSIAGSLEVPARLFPCPVTLLEFGATLLGKSAEIARLTGSLQVDSSKISDELGWRPRFTLAQGLQETAKWFRETGNRK